MIGRRLKLFAAIDVARNRSFRMQKHREPSFWHDFELSEPRLLTVCSLLARFVTFRSCERFSDYIEIRKVQNRAKIDAVHAMTEPIAM